MKLSLQQYRKTVGIKVLNQKPNQKLGISAAKPSSQKEAMDDPSSNTNTISCPKCSSANAPTSLKCQKCMFGLDKINLPGGSSQDHSKNDSSQSSKQISAKQFYKSRQSPAQGTQTSRQGKRAVEEPHCVTLSSDDESDSNTAAKKLKEDDNCKSFTGADESNLASNGEEKPNVNQVCKMETDAENYTELKVSGSQNEEELWKHSGFKGPFIAVECRTIRVGSYKFGSSSRVLISSEGIVFEAPVSDSGEPPTSFAAIIIRARQLLYVGFHSNRHLHVIFVNVTPSVSREVSLQLGLTRGGGPYWDALSAEDCQRGLTLLPSNLTDEMRNAIKNAIVPLGVFKELSATEANRHLVNTSPPEVRETVATVMSKELSVIVVPKNLAADKENGSRGEARTTRGSTKIPVRMPLPVEFMFAWSDGVDRFSMTTEEYSCLDQDNLLNDSIIDFYLRYVFSTKLDESMQKRCYVFSSFFYQRLTTRPPKNTGRKHPIEDDMSLPLRERRHSRVKSWTKKVDLFDKDYLLIPINERSHWFLAIVCFAGMAGPVYAKDNRPVTPVQNTTNVKKVSVIRRNPSTKLIKVGGESFHIGNTTITPVGPSGEAINIPVNLNVDADRDEAESDEDNAIDAANDIRTANSEPIKRPCIMIFDSLAGCSHSRVAATLREYLMVEYQVKKERPSVNTPDKISGQVAQQDCNISEKLFSKETIAYACLDVPQQKNSYDCGVYVLQYAEAFMKKPFTDYNLSKINLSSWFPSYIAGRKRKDIQSLLIRLTKERNTNSEQVLKLLPQDDVRIALQNRQTGTVVPSSAALGAKPSQTTSAPTAE